jgi:hypothetical protein
VRAAGQSWRSRRRRRSSTLMPASHHTDHVFAYGSLVRDLAGGEQLVRRAAHLRDHRRAWNVAMDNSLTLPGYKYYLDAEDRSRPEVFVTFLNLLPAPGHRVNGMLVPVDAAELVELDRRERNYERREVTASIEPVAEGRVWSYFGKPDACRRTAGCTSGRRRVLPRARASRLRGVVGRCACRVRAEHRRARLPNAEAAARGSRLSARRGLSAGAGWCARRRGALRARLRYPARLGAPRAWVLRAGLPRDGPARGQRPVPAASIRGA